MDKLIALLLCVLGAGFCFGVMAEKVRVERKRLALPKAVLDEIEEMIAG